jgi:hypothetical protein
MSAKVEMRITVAHDTAMKAVECGHVLLLLGGFLGEHRQKFRGSDEDPAGATQVARDHGLGGGGGARNLTSVF